MQKKIILCLCIVIVFSIISFITVIIDNHVEYTYNFKTGIVITEKETALKIGRAILEECMPENSLYTNGRFVFNFEAEEKNGIWRVYSFYEPSEETKEAGMTWMPEDCDGLMYVEFRKDNGKVIKVHFGSVHGLPSISKTALFVGAFVVGVLITVLSVFFIYNKAQKVYTKNTIIENLQKKKL